MLQRLSWRDSVFVAVSKHFCYQILRLFWDVVSIFVESEFSTHYFPLDLVVARTWERRVPAEEDVKEDSKWPNIAFLIIIPDQHLRCHIIWLKNLSKNQTNPLTVPFSFVILSSDPTWYSAEAPKSIIFSIEAEDLFASKILSNFRSLCTILLSWQKTTPSNIYFIMSEASFSEKEIFSFRKSKRSPPTQYLRFMRDL